MKKIKTLLPLMVLSILLSMALSIHTGAYTVDRLHMETWVEKGTEYAIIYGYQNNHFVPVWSYETSGYPAAQLSHFSLLDVWNENAYFVEDGSLVCLDRDNGSLSWINTEFKGSPASGCYRISSSGKVYLSGYDGPDLFICDSQGNTLTRVGSLKEGSYWPYKMQFTGNNNLMITYESDESSFEFDVTDYFGIIADESVNTRTAPDAFYGIWCGASQNYEDARRFAENLTDKGLFAKIYFSPEWSNMNPDPWFIVSAGEYSSESNANADLSYVRNYVSNAYVKYTGSYIG